MKALKFLNYTTPRLLNVYTAAAGQIIIIRIVIIVITL